MEERARQCATGARERVPEQHGEGMLAATGMVEEKAKGNDMAVGGGQTSVERLQDPSELASRSHAFLGA